MKTFIKFIAIILLATFLISCGSKKKQVEKTKSQIEVTRKLDSVASSNTFIASAAKESVNSNETEKEETIEYNGKPGDSLKVIKKGANGKVLSETIYTGSGKATLTSKEKTENKTYDKSEASAKTADSNVSVKEEDSKKESAEAKNVDIEKSGFTFMTWVWILFVVAIIVGIWYLNNKFNIILRIKNLI